MFNEGLPQTVLSYHLVTYQKMCDRPSFQNKLKTEA
jgi:hypothetical protein